MREKGRVASVVGGVSDFGDDFVISRPTFAEGTYVCATRDFKYDTNKIGFVRLGQVFQLSGARNDAALVDHEHVMVLDPQPKNEKSLEKYASNCGECGRLFREEAQRDRCGRMHEMTEEQRQMEKRRQAHESAIERSTAYPSLRIGE